MPVQETCPSCNHRGLSVFYEVDNVPVHSCLMVDSERESLDFPRDSIRLGFCTHCGFVTNVVFDPRYSAYSARYEDQQSFSATFNRFARELSADLIERYDLHGKRVVEIGCGKADFLALVCEMGGNEGVGIDPTCVKERIGEPAASRITVIADYYSEKYGDYVGDLIMCRHTLEHIQQTGEFLSTIRRSIGERRDTALFFEIPDAGRVIRDLAFEDIYYEHCTYYAPGSCARLFRATGFDVTRVALEYDDQYLIVEGVPSRSARGDESSAGELEETPAQMEAHVNSFASRISAYHDEWRERVAAMVDSGRRPVIWGSGSKCVAFLTTLGLNREIGAIVDINPHRHGKFIPGIGREISSPESLRAYEPNTVIVMNRIYTREIGEQLAAMDLHPELVAL